MFQPLPPDEASLTCQFCPCWVCRPAPLAVRPLNYGCPNRPSLSWTNPDHRFRLCKPCADHIAHVLSDRIVFPAQ